MAEQIAEEQLPTDESAHKPEAPAELAPANEAPETTAAIPRGEGLEAAAAPDDGVRFFDNLLRFSHAPVFLPDNEDTAPRAAVS